MRGVSQVTKFTITYQRKVQVRPYEMLTIGLVREYETRTSFESEAFVKVANQVDEWIKTERARL